MATIFETYFLLKNEDRGRDFSDGNGNSDIEIATCQIRSWMLVEAVKDPLQPICADLHFFYALQTSIDDRVHKLPAINGSADLKEALQKLASIPASRTLAVEVLWTPQNENDTLSERELLEDYPLLRPL
ncbi:hypothetical protein TEA_026043 [Camellia sinensis var. sinensis]|uniref:DUF1517 domain-containing protein n=1 Tax=Camellia sinensis var. sinensis TaxID=542762 RepID=A0A4S4ENC6_CAMSN|nr:hypothetical protein TEA_026043 [Camellia sinensis var. sinensis]